MLEFFGLKDFHDGGFHFIREAEGAWSWQHITFVSLCLAVMFALAIFFGLRNKNKTDKKKNKVLIVSAFLINGFEIVKIVVLCIRAQDPLKWLYVLPLFLCSIQLIAIPMAAFCFAVHRDFGNAQHEAQKFPDYPFRAAGIFNISIRCKLGARL